MGMTVAEKEALQAILKQKIEDRIEGLEVEAAADFKEMDENSRQKALVHLEIDEEFRSAMTIYERIQEDKKRLDKLWAMLAERLDLNRRAYRLHEEVNGEVERKAKVFKRTMMAEHPVGQKILALEKEKKDMLSTIWLATSTKQVKELFTKLDGILGNQMTEFEKEVLAIEPVSE
jgi:hypothetical protein